MPRVPSSPRQVRLHDGRLDDVDVVRLPQFPISLDEFLGAHLPVQPRLVHLFALRVGRRRAIFHRLQEVREVVSPHERVGARLDRLVLFLNGFHVHRANDADLRPDVRGLFRHLDIRARHALDLQAQVASEGARLERALGAVQEASESFLVREELAELLRRELEKSREILGSAQRASEAAASAAGVLTAAAGSAARSFVLRVMGGARELETRGGVGARAPRVDRQP